MTACVKNKNFHHILIDLLIDWIEFYAISAICQSFNGSGHHRRDRRNEKEYAIANVNYNKNGNMGKSSLCTHVD